MKIIAKNLFNIVSTLLLSVSVQAQVCVNLPENTVCGSTYSGYPANIPTIENTFDFNNYITSHIKNTTLVAQAFNQDFGCNLELLPLALESLRYQLSITCSEIVYDALENKGCETQASHPDYGPILCEQECLIALNSVAQLFTNQQVCPAQDEFQVRRNAFYDNISNNCAAWKEHKHGNSDYCVAGVQAEIVHCGFSSHETANKGCAMLNDACCMKLKSTTVKFPMIALWIGIACVALISLLLTAWFFRKKIMNSSKKDKNLPNKHKHLDLHSSKDEFDTKVLTLTKAMSDLNRPTAPNSHADLEIGLRSSSPLNQSLHKTPSIMSDAVTEVTEILVIDNNPSSFTSLPLSPENQNAQMFMQSPLITKRVIYNYSKKELDECTIKREDQVSITQLYSDGWALGINHTSLEKGIFPLACIEKEDQVRRDTLSEMRRDGVIVEKDEINKVEDSRVIATSNTQDDVESVESEAFNDKNELVLDIVSSSNPDRIDYFNYKTPPKQSPPFKSNLDQIIE